MSQLLKGLEQQLEIHANPGRFVAGQGLLMEKPSDSRFLSNELGVDKLKIVRESVEQNATVAFAGDGFPDFQPALQVPAELRFARGDLAQALDAEGLPYRRFENWSEIAGALLGTASRTC
jgi:2-hydroxy-3-keto-5-methylthiopentenyl-1-phosphate phosphatase